MSCRWRGRTDEARYELEVARELDPLAPSIALSETLLEYHERRYDVAAAGFRRVIEANPRFWLAHYFLGWSMLESDAPANAIGPLETARDLSSGAVSGSASSR